MKHESTVRLINSIEANRHSSQDFYSLRSLNNRSLNNNTFIGRHPLPDDPSTRQTSQRILHGKLLREFFSIGSYNSHSTQPQR